MEEVFKIKTVNNTYGEVFVNAPLDRESVDRYLLKVRQQSTCSYDLSPHVYMAIYTFYTHTITLSRCLTLA